TTEHPIAIQRVTPEKLVTRTELVIDFSIPSCTVRPALGRHNKVIRGSARGDGSGVIGRLPGIPAEDVPDDRVIPVCRHDVAGKLVTYPRSGGVLPGCGGVIDWESASVEIEVAGIHLRGGHRPDEGFGDFFVVALEAGEEEGSILSVV